MNSSVTWLHGILGYGRTVLTSAIIDDVRQYCADDPDKAAAYLYFNFKDPQKQSPQNMIRSLLTQLSQKCIRIPSGLGALFASSNNGQS